MEVYWAFAQHTPSQNDLALDSKEFLDCLFKTWNKSSFLGKILDLHPPSLSSGYAIVNYYEMYQIKIV